MYNTFLLKLCVYEKKNIFCVFTCFEYMWMDAKIHNCQSVNLYTTPLFYFNYYIVVKGGMTII